MKAVHQLRFCFDARNPAILGSDLFKEAEEIRLAGERERRTIWTKVKMQADALERKNGVGAGRVTFMGDSQDDWEDAQYEADTEESCYLVIDEGQTHPIPDGTLKDGGSSF